MNAIKYDRDANDLVSLTQEFSDEALEAAGGAALEQMAMATGVVFCTGLDTCPA
jgi:hypothetical protein